MGRSRRRKRKGCKGEKEKEEEERKRVTKERGKRESGGSSAGEVKG